MTLRVRQSSRPFSFWVRRPRRARSSRASRRRTYSRRGRPLLPVRRRRRRPRTTSQGRPGAGGDGSRSASQSGHSRGPRVTRTRGPFGRGCRERGASRGSTRSVRDVGCAYLLESAGVSDSCDGTRPCIESVISAPARRDAATYGDAAVWLHMCPKVSLPDRDSLASKLAPAAREQGTRRPPCVLRGAAL